MCDPVPPAAAATSGIHQIPIDPETVHKTAFVTRDGHFEYLRIPFGLANAPAVSKE